MKFTVKLYLYWVSIFLFFYLGVLLVICLMWKVRPDPLRAALVFFLVGMLPPAIITLYFSKRLDYMESDDLNPPSFPGQKSMTFQFVGSSARPFDEIMQRMDRQWIISYSDRKSHILKFRTDARMTSWGLGGYLKLRADGSILVIVFPVSPHSKREKVMVEQLFLLMDSVLACRKDILHNNG